MNTPPKKPAATPLKKRIIFALYLIQPVLQFFVLIAALGLLNRCSPLAPSTEKNPTPVKNLVTSSTDSSDHAQISSEEARLVASLRDLPADSTQFLMAADLESLLQKNSMGIEEANALVFGKKEGYQARILGARWLLLLDKDTLQLLAQSGRARANLNLVLAKSAIDAALPGLQNRLEMKALTAKRYLAFQNADLNESQKDAANQLKSDLENIEVSISAVDSSKVVIELRLAESTANFENFQSALRNVNQLAILLE